MGRQLFGTDGIRGEAGKYPLDDETVGRLGRSLVRFLQQRGRSGRVVLGYDTRQSSVPLPPSAPLDRRVEPGDDVLGGLAIEKCENPRDTVVSSRRA